MKRKAGGGGVTIIDQEVHASFTINILVTPPFGYLGRIFYTCVLTSVWVEGFLKRSGSNAFSGFWTGRPGKESFNASRMNSQYIDIQWLTTFGCFKVNALEYFYTSHFYDPECNNQLIRNQGVSVEHLIGMVGWEYSLDEEHIDEPHLYVIRKAYRKSPKEIEVAEVFYILDGIIYQSPNLYDLFRVKTSKINFNLLKSFNEIRDNIGYNDTLGYYFNNNKAIDTAGGDEQKGGYTDKQKEIAVSHLPDYKQLLLDIETPAFD